MVPTCLLRRLPFAQDGRVSLLDYLQVLRRRWWVILLVTALGVLAAVALSVTTPPTYEARATIYASVSGNATPADLQSGSAFATQRVGTYADLAVTTTVLDRATAALGNGFDIGQLRESVTSGARLDKSLIDITATGNDPDAVASQANAVAAALITEAPLLDVPGPTNPVRLTVVQTAETPDVPIAPSPLNNLLIGIAVGLVLGVVVVVVADSLSTRIRSSADLPRAAGLVTLTSMPSGPERRLRHMVATDPRQESFRQLRANLQFGSHVEETIAVAGVTAASDAHTVARQLAAAFAEIGASVVVVDLDLRPDSRRHRRSRQAAPAPPQPGVAEVLAGSATVDDVVIRAADSHVHEVAAGQADITSAQLMSTPAMRVMLEKLKARFEYVVLACPPLVERSESAVAAALAGSALVVVESGATRRSEFLFALELLAGVRVTSVSVAIDHVRDQDLGGGSLRRFNAPAGPESEILT
ncbi:Wzz/FepE/Etk N-terminal domain-containing protein [Geodermatophilus sp. SYSU D00804]